MVTNTDSIFDHASGIKLTWRALVWRPVLLGVLLALVVSCSSNDESPAGFFAADDHTASFLQWTRSKDTLEGTAQSAEITSDNKVDQNTGPFSGVIAGSSITLTFKSLFGFTANATGTLRDGRLEITVPTDDGSLQTVTYRKAVVADYNEAVGKLHQRAAELAQAAAQVRAEAEAQRAAEQLAREAAAQAEATERAKARAEAAAAVVSQFRQTCRAHGGSLSASSDATVGYNPRGPNTAGEYCVVTYAGQGTFIVPIAGDGSFDQKAADANKSDCQSDAEDARINAEDGQPWQRQPQYHSESGVCDRGER